MKIRNQLALLVAGVVVPVALLAGLATTRLWHQQREAYEERLVERVSGLRLALDAELDATTRTLRAMSGSIDPVDRARLPTFAPRFERFLGSNPTWAEIGVLDERGQVAFRVDEAGGAPVPGPPPALFEQLRMTRQPAVSGLVAHTGKRAFVTYLAVPIVREERLLGSLYIVIPAAGWLRFLQSYPLADSATLSLADGEGTVIARTLRNDEWAGTKVSAEFIEATRDNEEASFRATALEGQPLYTATSRSRRSGWLLITGVPSEAAEAALRISALATAAVVALAALFVGAFAFGIGRRIMRSFTELAAAARSLPGERAAGDGPLSVDEAETVRLALAEAARQLRARDAVRNAALDRAAEARAEAEQANAAKDEFLAMLGHELRNPLNAIKSASALLAMPKAKPMVHERSREVIERQTRRLTDLVDDLLDVARLNSGKIVLKRAPVDLAALAGDVIASFQDGARCIHLRVTTDLQPAIVDGDETRLEQILANLFDNACKYTPAGGSVHVATRSVDDRVTLTLADSGSGIGADLMPHLFEAFAQGARTLARAEGGLGLGLAVVKRLVELHGGVIEAKSAGADRGTTFSLTLPRGSAAVEAPALAESPEVSGLRIVIVEDNVDNGELIGTLLLLRGHDVVATASDGHVGLAAIERERPDLALVDVGLPGIDGFELARRVRAGPLGRSVRLFALTGYGLPEDRARATASGFDGFLVKPFDMATFDAAVRTGGTLTVAEAVPADAA